MEINKISKGNKRYVTNPEGSLVRQRIPEIQLYLEASNLNIKEDKFYQSAQDKLKSFIELAKESDKTYLLGLARFLADNGIKLSPVVLLSVLSNMGFSFRDKNLNYIFNTPQRISEAVSLDNTIKLNNSFKKNILRVSLENMKGFTLKKNQLKGRKIKTRDLIKLLRPKPNDEKISELYKNLIEGTAKLEEKTLVRVKSDKKLTTEEKIKYLTENIEKIAINELVRNLRFITDNCDFTKNIELQKKVLAKLNSITNFRYLNVFDLIEAAMHVPELEKMLFEVIKNFVKKVKNEFEYDKDATFLFDISGSMQGEGVNRGFKYFVLLNLLFENSKLRLFNSGGWGYNNDSGLLDESESAGIVELVRKGKLSEAFARFNPSGGTALLASTKDLIEQDSEIRNLIIISDEVSWEEGSDLRGEIDELSKLLNGKRLVLINPEVYQGTVFKDNVMAFASLSSSIIYNVALHINPQKFVSYIRDYGKE